LVYLFGSVARGTAHAGSDVDVGVLLAEDPPRTLEGPKKTSQGADFDLAVHRDDAPLETALHDDVATGLTHLVKAEPLKCALDLCS
jgi:predicted nucleotidyltransferase